MGPGLLKKQHNRFASIDCFPVNNGDASHQQLDYHDDGAYPYQSVGDFANNENDNNRLVTHSTITTEAIEARHDDHYQYEKPRT